MTWQPSYGPLFALIHFQVLCYFLGVFSSCLFPSLANDTHIIGLAHVISLTFDHFASQLAFVGLFVFSLGFVCLTSWVRPPCGIKILGVLFGFASFVFVLFCFVGGFR
jgi:hypothetical protein